jgi:farnesyl diphosphate synthase
LAPAEELRFTQALTETAAAVDTLLDRLLPPNGTRIADAMRYAALGHGKRLRPFLVVQSASLFNVAPTNAMHVGAALECIHCYSLVHDDLPAMDNDDLRRGMPTTHRKFDEATAILAGDALLTLAFEITASPSTHANAETRTKLVTALAAASGAAGMVGGQMRDIEAETKNFASLAEISEMQAGKTGALFRFACESGAILSGQDQGKLRQYADHLGVAFQIADDILDVESDAATIGKATQKDSSKGKATFVSFLGLEGARREASRLSQAAIDVLDTFGPSADLLRYAARFVITRRK